ncbi:ComEC/Rec2 family competence protein [Lacticaseibacillus zhaodongensis]|uniref:ComEC/Rec2 family competence protein n=1 Tax=Lacticaseibacillus zhaodongensis TaxID=2668065 RepID=UPI0012D36B10|nr:ComEC/Rec2 family competence protein [Lacticaseibacillus zhaodongensis]
MSRYLLPVVGLVIGAQLLFTGAIIPGLVLLAFATQKGRPWPPVLITAAICLGVCGGVRERALTLAPPVPRGAVLVQAGDWQFKPEYASFRGVCTNGVVVTGGVPITRPELRRLRAVAGPVLVNWQKSARITGPSNLYEFDYAAYAWAQYHAAYRVRADKLRMRPLPIRGLQAHLQRLRVGIVRRIDRLPERVAAYAQALLLGTMGDEMVSMRDTFSRLGILHLFSVSGLHIFALVGILYALTNRLRIPCEYTDCLLIGILPLLLVIIPGGAGLIRAVWMRLLQILAQRLHWTVSTLDCFCIVLLINSLFQPRVLFTLGGQMTYLLTFVLIVAPTAGTLRQSINMAGVSAAPLLSAVYGLHLLTFLFNWALMPLFEGVLMPLLVMLVIWPSCPLSLPVNQLLLGLDHLLTRLAGLPGYLSAGAFPGLLALGLSVLVLRGLATRRWRQCVIAFGLCYLAVNYHPYWRVSCFDLGQGEAQLIEAPFKRGAVLIDTGGQAYQSGSNPAAKRIILNYLAARGLNHLDAVVLTNGRREYIGDVATILQGISCKTLIVNAAAANSKVIKDLAPNLRTRVQLVRSKAAAQIGPARVTIFPGSAARVRNQSLQIYAKLGSKKYLFGGAATRAQERQLLQEQLDVDYLKLGQHGSVAGVDAAFVRSITPSAGFVVGSGTFAAAHPSTETFKLFAELPAPIYETQRQGMIYVDQWGSRAQTRTYRQNK